MKPKYIKVSVKARFRDYTYTAMLRPNGELVCIKAGCRHWVDFGEAADHYRDSVRWRDAEIASIARTNLWAACCRFANRYDARTALCLLQRKVEDTALRLSKARKRKKPIKKRA